MLNKRYYRIIAINMGTTKNIAYKASQKSVSNWAKALAHPARIAIIDYLSQQNTCVCGDIVKSLDLSQSTVSQHLKALKEIGLIKGEIEGAKTCYCLDPDQWEIFKKEMNSYLETISTNTISCCSND